MKDEKIYTPAKAEILKQDTTDVITTSPAFDTELSEGEWDEFM